MGQIMFETDYPPAKPTWDHSSMTADTLCTEENLTDHERWQFVRGNAITCFRPNAYFNI